MRIDKLMTRHVTTCRPEDSLERAASLLWDSDCGCLPVTGGIDGHWLEGIITDRDICMAALFQGRPLRELRVEDAMTRKVHTCRAGDEIEEAQRLMQNAQVRRLPVLDDQGALAGIVSMADIVRESARLQFAQHQEIPAGTVTYTLAKISTPAPEPASALGG
jgi:CBS-domain-containing membrane protein